MKNLRLPMTDAVFPHPFKHTLEYNPPVHVTWNIVHIGMQVPDSIQVYICANNCMRGVIATAYEMGAEDRFSCVVLYESDIMRGDMEEQIIAGVKESIEERDRKPRVVIVFPVCIHKILSTDLDYVYKKLREMYPDIVFCEAMMDPISQKEGIAPDTRLRYRMFNGVLPETQDDGINILGSEVYYDQDADFKELLTGIPIRQLHKATYQDYLDLGRSQMTICTYPAGKAAMEKLSRRLNQKFMYLPMTFDYDEIEAQEKAICVKAHIPYNSLELKDACEQALKRLSKKLGQMEIVIDYVAVPSLLSLARLLLDHGFHVTELYVDDLLEEEAEDFNYLKAHYPQLMLVPTIQAGMRFFKETGEVLAIGPKAAFFRDTVHFVNIIEGGGLWGYRGILKLCTLMEEAMDETKDPRDYVSRKGLGCECVL